MDAEPIQQTDATPSADAEPTDADLIAAAQEVGGAASVDVDAEAAAAAARTADAANPKPGGAPAVAPTGEPEEPKIAALIRAREKANAERLEAQDYAAQTRAKAEQEAESIRAAARKQAAADYEADLEARRAKFRQTPGAAIRELGFTHDQVVEDVTQEGTATFRAIRAAEARAAAAEAKASTVDKVVADFDAFKNHLAQQQQIASVQATEREFLSTHAAPEKAPYLHKRYEPAEILDKAHSLAREWRAAGIPFANGDVAEYLEHQARQRLAGVPVPAQQVSAGGSGQKVRPGSRTLSPANGSERRASPKPIEEMTPDEERIALIEAAAEARRTGGG